MRHWLRNLALLASAVLLSPLVLILYVIVASSGESYDLVSSVPAEPVAIVFGAGITGRNQLSRMLADRVETAAQLYAQRRVGRLLMTGDSRAITHDEATAMQRFAVARGVSRNDIALDYAGLSTYESCYRARVVFGVTQAVVVTQQYHLPRAVYTCRALGIDVVGMGTPDWGTYPDELIATYTAREGLAILKALWDLHVARPTPTFLGPYEGWPVQGS